MVAGIDRYLTRRLEEAPVRRDAAGRPAKVLRERLRELIGAVDARLAFEAPVPEATLHRSEIVAATPSYTVRAIRWPVFAGVDGEGLLLEPRQPPRGRFVALGDADWTPEMLAGLAPGVAAEAQFARRLAESGFLVVIPTLIDRDDTHSGREGVRFTNQPHREFIYRMAYEMGRHIIGYEVQKVLALVDWFSASSPNRPIGIAGYGEGGLLALHAAALDERIQAALVSGYFAPREEVWSEPIYRNIWGQLEELGDAEIAGLVTPRTLIIEASPHPEVPGPPPEREGRRGAAPGRIRTPSAEAVRSEFERARRIWERQGATKGLSLVDGGPGSNAALTRLVQALDPGARPAAPGRAPADLRSGYDPSLRHKRQFDQLIDYTQHLVRRSEFVRRRFISRLDFSSLEAYERSAEPYRRIFWEEVIGKMPPPSEPLAPETRRVYDTDAFTGYEVLLPVWSDVFAYGILLVPKNLRPGERRPVVVCQHGLEGRPQDLIAPENPQAETVYARFAARLAERGYVVYAPQNPYIGGHDFRILLRKAHPLKLSLFSFIIGQHQRTLEWLAKLPFVDPARIGFYGLSYGGKTAMRVPAVLREYALSICSADFNEWIWKITDLDHPFSYMYTVEYDMLEFNLGHTFNYAEMAALIAPRPFMVERGHRDGVSIDEWVAYEYATVRRHYADLKLPGRTRIEFFDGPHQIHGVGTFEFLEEHLGRPAARP
jgi:dienelactone hydrolase